MKGFLECCFYHASWLASTLGLHGATLHTSGQHPTFVQLCHMSSMGGPSFPVFLLGQGPSSNIICNMQYTAHNEREIEVNNIEEECIYVVNKSVTDAGRGVVAPFYGLSSC